MSLKDLYTDTATDVADEFYPKGDKRRGRFIRDAAVLFAYMNPKVIDMLKQWTEEAKQTHAPLTYIIKKIEEMENEK